MSSLENKLSTKLNFRFSLHLHHKSHVILELFGSRGLHQTQSLQPGVMAGCGDWPGPGPRTVGEEESGQESHQASTGDDEEEA